MTPDKIMVIIGGLGLIGFVWWFFFGKKDEMFVSGKNTEILVEGGYIPSTVKIKVGEKSTLTFLRKDENTCLEEVVFPDFKIKKYLPVGTRVEIEIAPKKKGEFQFHCSMNMFHGKLIVY